MFSELPRRRFDTRVMPAVTKNFGNRRWLGTVLLIGLLALLAGSARAAEPDYELTVRPKQTDQQRVQAEVRIEGKLKLNSDGQGVRKIPLHVSASMVYVEKLTEVEAASSQSIRAYEKAKAEMRIGGMSLKSSLRDDRQLIGAAWGGVQRPVVFSPSGPLTQEELDLVDIQANSLCLAALAPTEAVHLGQTWRHGAAAMVGLLNLDAVVKTDARSELLRVSDDVATIKLSGTVDGVVGGVATEIQLQGQWNLDLDRQLVTRVSLTISENRAIGHAQPGFETTSRILLVLQRASGRFPLDEQSLEDLDLTPSESNQWIRFASIPAGVRFLHDRNWSVMAEHIDGVVMRNVAGGELIAQCNIVPLRKLPPGEQLSLEKFQADVKQTLEQRFGQFIEASQSEEGGLRILRVVASGTVSDLPIRWIYYHVSDADGDRGSVVFTLEESLVEPFGAGDLPIVRSLEFAKKKPGDEPTGSKEE